MSLSSVDERENIKHYSSVYEPPREGPQLKRRNSLDSIPKPSKTPLKRPTSILKTPSSERESPSQRRDNYGNPIETGSKKHKIKFKNEIRVVEEIENWKEYNKEDKPCSVCQIF